MKICPQCSKIYSDDDVFCPEDGNTLIEEGGDQGMRPVPFVGKQVEPSHSIPQPEPRSAPKPRASRYEGTTIPAPPPIFKAPRSGSNQLPPAATSKKTVLIAAVGGGVAVLALVLIGMYGLGGRGGGGNGQSGGNIGRENKNVAAPSPSPALPGTFDREYAGTIGNNKSLSMKLVKDGNNLTGTARTTTTETLKGTIQDNGDFKVDSSPAGKDPAGIFSGHINPDGSVTGEWSNLQDGQKRPFKVQQQ